MPALISAAPWWKLGWGFRLPVEIHAGQFPRFDRPVELRINFTQELHALGRSDAFDEHSIRVVEVDEKGNLRDPVVSFQFDKLPGFDPFTHAEGSLVLYLGGTTPAGGARRFQVYFDVAGQNYSYEPTSSITVEDEVLYRGQTSVKIATPAATYYYHKLGAAFAGILDAGGNDWVGYRPAGPGRLRGLPILGGCCRAGGIGANTEIVSQGPLRTTLRSESANKDLAVRWDVYPTYARMTVLHAAGNYRFVYSGTPGGRLAPESEHATLASGNSKPLTESWEGDIPGPEWIYFDAPGEKQIFYLVNHQDDDAADRFFARNRTAVFRFGAQPACCAAESNTPQAVFTIGFADKADPQTIAARINSAYQPLFVARGAPEARSEEQRAQPGGTATSRFMGILRGIGASMRNSKGIK